MAYRAGRGMKKRTLISLGAALAAGVSALATLSFAAGSLDRLYAGIDANDTALVQQALSAKPSLEPRCGPNEICKPLARAAGKGNLSMVKALVAAGADLNGRNAYGDTAFIIAGNFLKATSGAEDEKTVRDIRRFLLESGMDSNQSNQFGVTAFAGLADQGDIELMEVALRHGAKINHRSKETGYTALMLAAAAGRLEAMRWLLAHGADPALKSKKGQTALDAATLSKKPEAARLLREL
jgi:ankyrin repeat protein